MNETKETKQLIDDFKSLCRAISNHYEDYYLEKNTRIVSEVLSDINNNLFILVQPRLLRERQVSYIYDSIDKLYGFLLELDSLSALDTYQSYKILLEKFLDLSVEIESYEISNNIYKFLQHNKKIQLL